MASWGALPIKGSADEIRVLVDNASPQERVEWFAKLAESMAKKFGGTEDAIADAYEGLLIAAHKYEPGRGAFATYARLMIRQRLIRSLKHRMGYDDLPVDSTEGFSDYQPGVTLTSGDPPVDATVADSDEQQATFDELVEGLRAEDRAELMERIEFFRLRDGTRGEARRLAGALRVAKGKAERDARRRARARR